MTSRWALLLVLLGLTLGASWWAASLDDGSPQPSLPLNRSVNPSSVEGSPPASRQGSLVTGDTQPKSASPKLNHALLDRLTLDRGALASEAAISHFGWLDAVAAQAPIAAAKPLPPTVQAPPAKPQMPPPPFRYLGRVDEAAGQRIFLMLNDEPIVVRAGETFASAWRLDSIDESGILVTWLPLGEQRRLRLSQ